MAIRLYGGTDRVFLLACELASVKPTRRQRRKWERREGTARQHEQAAKEAIAAQDGGEAAP